MSFTLGDALVIDNTVTKFALVTVIDAVKTSPVFVVSVSVALMLVMVLSIWLPAVPESTVAVMIKESEFPALIVPTVQRPVVEL